MYGIAKQDLIPGTEDFFDLVEHGGGRNDLRAS